MTSRPRRRTSLAARLKARIRAAFSRTKKAIGVAVLAASCFAAGTRFTGSVDEAWNAVLQAGLSAASDIVRIPGFAADVLRRASSPASASASASASAPASQAPAPSTTRLTAQVAQVPEGDTLTLLTPRSGTVTVRLLGIDAPGPEQPGGRASQMALLSLVMGKTVTASWRSAGEEGLPAAKILVDGKDAGLEQVRAGHAWLARTFPEGVPPDEARTYAAAETRARGARLGLWKDPDPVPPWQFRQQQSESALRDFRDKAALKRHSKKSLWERAKDALP